MYYYYFSCDPLPKNRLLCKVSESFNMNNPILNQRLKEFRHQVDEVGEGYSSADH